MFKLLGSCLNTKNCKSVTYPAINSRWLTILAAKVRRKNSETIDDFQTKQKQQFYVALCLIAFLVNYTVPFGTRALAQLSA
jgi:O-acetyl-ADP-ribose deacetylase (regulator of RNase III)